MGVNVRYKAKREARKVIYQLRFPNNKIYIGQTMQLLRERMRQHCRDAVNMNRGCHDVKNRAIRKYKEFEVSVLDTCASVDEMNIRESEIINKKRQEGEELYNTASGGLNNCKYFANPCVLLDKEFNVLKSFSKIKHLKEFLGRSTQTSCNGKYRLIDKKYYVMHQKEYNSYSIREHDERRTAYLKEEKRKLELKKEERQRIRDSKPKEFRYNVIQINHKHEYMRTMDIDEALQEFGRLIEKKMSGKKEYYAYGFYWMMEDDYKANKENLKELLTGLDYVYKISSEGKVIGEYYTVREAALAHRFKPDTISNNMIYHNITSSEFFFMKQSEYESIELSNDYISRRTQQTSTGESIAVGQYNIRGELIMTYDSIKECARAINAQPYRVGMAIRSELPYRGKIYKRV